MHSSKYKSVYDYRVERVKDLIEAGFVSKKAFAEFMDMKPTQLSRYLTKKQRMGDDVARRIEELNGLPRNILDQPHIILELDKNINELVNIIQSQKNLHPA